jgi:hypothetical protein
MFHQFRYFLLPSGGVSQRLLKACWSSAVWTMIWPVGDETLFGRRPVSLVSKFKPDRNLLMWGRGRNLEGRVKGSPVAALFVGGVRHSRGGATARVGLPQRL